MTVTYFRLPYRNHLWSQSKIKHIVKNGLSFYKANETTNEDFVTPWITFIDKRQPRNLDGWPTINTNTAVHINSPRVELPPWYFRTSTSYNEKVYLSENIKNWKTTSFRLSSLAKYQNKIMCLAERRRELILVVYIRVRQQSHYLYIL